MRTMRVLSGLAVVLTVILASGCEKPLFPKEASRSPYERYQILRGQQRPMTTENAYGGDVPAIRERLRPLGSP